MGRDAFRERLLALDQEGDAVGSVSFLSDITRPEQAQVRAEWPQLPLGRRRHIVRQLVELAELSVDLDFTRVFLVALDDEDPEVRAAAIEGLWEDDSLQLLRRLVDVVEHDPSVLVRAAAVQSLARFTLRAVMGQVDEEWANRLHALLLGIAVDPNAELEARRRAVEAVAVFPNDEAVHQAIERAYADDRLLMRASALYAMGRNLDLRWLDIIIAEMRDPQPALRYEAARASGELGSQRAVPALLDMLSDTDREAQLAAVAALGKVGGRVAATALRKLLHSPDEPLREAAEDAIDELNFGANPLMIG